jgi:DNA primase
VEEVKSKTDIVALVGEYVKLSRAGRNFKGLCPFHGEKTPSFMVNPELQIFKCFGCGAGGDVLEFLQKIEGAEFGEALKTLAKRAGITLVSFVPTKGEEEKDRLIRVNSGAADYYHYLLTKHALGKPALNYLTERKISPEAIETFKLGFAPEGWDYLISYLHGKKNFTVSDLERAGLIVPSSQGGYDRFRNRVMFPLNNHRGQTVGFAGRVMPGADEKAGGKYVNTPETEIYHKGDLLYGLDVNRTEIKSKGWVVIVEGEIDAIASRQAGLLNTVAIKGSALTARQVELLKRYADTIVLSLDADLAGDMAARRGIEIAEKAGMIVKVTNPKYQITNYKYKDPGECATEDPELWRKIVEEAVPIYDFYMASAVDRHGLSAVGKTKIGRELLPIWAQIADEIARGHYIKKLAEVLGVDEDDVRRQLNKVSIPNTQTTKNEQITKDKMVKSRREVVEEYVVGLAVRNEALDRLISKPAAELIEGDFWKKITDFFRNNYKKKADIKELFAKMPAELRPKAEELFLVEDDFTEKTFDSEWEAALGELEELDIREKITAIRATGRQENRPKELLELTHRLNDLTKGR